jgi:hypothetical protein
VFAGFLLGLAIVALVGLVRAGIAAWIGLIVAMAWFGNNPSDPLAALAAGGAAWLVLRRLVRSRA